jgi:catechol 2,3-dioxygenase-like lactoylglutathione lyase family enzyme
MSDLGFTHVALSVRNLDESAAFYAKYARMRTVHQRVDAETGISVAWITDGTRPFVIVLAQWREPQDHPLGPFGHLGVGCESREEVDRLCAAARAEGRLRSGPTDTGYPVGYWAYISDPDGNNLEVSYGQEVGLTIERSQQKPTAKPSRAKSSRAKSRQ